MTILRKQIQAINEKVEPIVPKNDYNKKPTGKLKGDTIKIVKHYNNSLPIGSYWQITQEADTPNGKGGTYSNYILTKVLKNGKLSTSFMEGVVFISKKYIDTLIARSKVLEPGKPYTQGEITVDYIKTLLRDSGIEKLMGINAQKVVSKSQSYITINITSYKYQLEDSIRTLAFVKISKLLDRMKIAYKYFDNIGRERFIEGKDYPSHITIPKEEN